MNSLLKGILLGTAIGLFLAVPAFFQILSAANGTGNSTRSASLVLGYPARPSNFRVQCNADLMRQKLASLAASNFVAQSPN